MVKYSYSRMVLGEERWALMVKLTRRKLLLKGVLRERFAVMVKCTLEGEGAARGGEVEISRK
jgi:hypothetical protein